VFTDELLERLGDEGISTVAELLLLPPTSYDRPPLVPIAASMPEGPAVVRGSVVSRSVRFVPGGQRVEVVLAGPDGHSLRLRWPGRGPRGWERWSVGSELGFIGRISEIEEGTFAFYEGEPVGLDGRGSGIVPLYSVEGVEDRLIREAVALSLGLIQGALKDTVSAELIEQHRLLPLDEALRDAHFPANAAGRGRIRMAFEELFLLQLGIAWRAGRGQAERGFAHTIVHGAVGQLAVQHQITLSDGQESAFCDIRRDLLKPNPMTRLLQGDVGAGKGLVALLTAVVVAESGHQVAMIAPDPLTAERRFLHAEAVLRSVGLVPLLVGDTVNHAMTDAIRRGEVHVVFGTRRILEEQVHWKRLGLVIVEERGPYGTVSPQSLSSRSVVPDLLVVTKAPIPSSLSLTVFGDFDLSIVPSVERPRVTVKVFGADARAEAYARAWEEVEKGRQAFVVFPVRDGRDLLGVEDAQRMAKALQAEGLPGARIGTYCSAMSREERFRVFDDFQHRRVDVLVCTTYIEDAPPVDNASVVVVEYADMHDLVRLHRLRGHVAQGRHPGTCLFVLSNNAAEGASQVVSTVIHPRDGFRLAEVDLQVRGAEALLGDRATEMPEFRWADPPRDRDLLLRARAEAFQLVAADPGLRKSPDLARAVSLRWGDWLGQASATPESAKAADNRSRKGRRRRRRR
jgi:ATP-dependent DNA helicase RecG